MKNVHLCLTSLNNNVYKMFLIKNLPEKLKSLLEIKDHFLTPLDDIVHKSG